MVSMNCNPCVCLDRCTNVGHLKGKLKGGNKKKLKEGSVNMDRRGKMMTDKT